MSNENTYNGWTNWATWHVALLIDNDQPAQEREFAMAQHELKFKEKGTFDISRAVAWWKREFARFARETRNFARENWNEPAGEINWQEIAENAIENAELEREYNP